MQQIRINKTKDIDISLKYLRKKKYPLLSDSEILKVVLCSAYIEVLNEEKEEVRKKTSGTNINAPLASKNKEQKTIKKE